MRNVSDFVTSYLLRLGFHTTQANDIAQRAVENAIRVLGSLSSDYTIKGDTKKLVIWSFQAFRDMSVMATLEDDFKANLERFASEIRLITDSKDATMLAKKALLDVLSRLGRAYSAESAKLEELLARLGGSL